MNKVEITEVGERVVIWYNGKNVELNPDISIPNVIKLLNSAIKLLISKL